MYVPSWPGLTIANLLGRSRASLPYPLSADRCSAFYVARSGIYHLFRALKLRPEDTVLAPDYYSGNEVGAMQAAGATLAHYPIGPKFEPDMDALIRMLRTLRPRVVYVIHYLGWPQPMDRIERLCREYGSILVEDCALSMLSSSEGAPLGSRGHYSVFCLYKSLPVPNGGLLVQNAPELPALTGIPMEPCPPLGSVGRSAELALETVRSRSDAFGKVLFGVKRSVGGVLRAARCRHVPVGDIGWNIGNVNVGMSPLSRKVMANLNYDAIRDRRRENFQALRRELRGVVSTVRDDLPEGVCPLFFPILVKKKSQVAQLLQGRGIGAVDFWNNVQDNPSMGPHARHLRAHLLELPIHQEVAPRQIQYIASEVRKLRLEAAPC